MNFETNMEKLSVNDWFFSVNCFFSTSKIQKINLSFLVYSITGNEIENRLTGC